MVDLWLFVDLDGSELGSNEKPHRLYEWVEEFTSEEYRESHPKFKCLGQNRWVNDFDSDGKYQGFNFYFSGVEFPKGTIEWLVGKKMSWGDEPILFRNGEEA